MHQVSFHRKSLIFFSLHVCRILWRLLNIYRLWSVIFIFNLWEKKIDSINWFVLLLFCLCSDFFWLFIYTRHTPILHWVRSDREKNSSNLHFLWWGRIFFLLYHSLSQSHCYNKTMMFSNKFLSIFRKCVYIQSYKLARSLENKHTSDKRFKHVELK